MPILFIHGNSCSSKIFERQLDDPRLQEHHLVAVDLPGHGASTSGGECPGAPYHRYSLPYYARTLQLFCENVGLHAPVVVGNSFGGHIALAMAHRMNFRGLFLVLTPPMNHVSEMSLGFNQSPELSYLLQASISEDQIREVVLSFTYITALPEFIAHSLRATDPTCRELLAQSLSLYPELGEVNLLQQLVCPVRIGLCPHDRLINNDYLIGLDLTSNLHIEEIVFAESGHFPQYDEAEKFNGVLAGLLDLVKPD